MNLDELAAAAAQLVELGAARHAAFADEHAAEIGLLEVLIAVLGESLPLLCISIVDGDTRRGVPLGAAVGRMKKRHAGSSLYLLGDGSFVVLQGVDLVDVDYGVAAEWGVEQIVVTLHELLVQHLNGDSSKQIGRSLYRAAKLRAITTLLGAK